MRSRSRYLPLECFGDAVIGDRKEQQDAFQSTVFVDPDTGDTGFLLCLADGMGGHAGGAIAARLAVNSGIGGFLSATGDLHDRLTTAFRAANQAIDTAKAEDQALADMGCTFLLVIALPDRFHWCSIGDSLILQIRNGRLRRINADHSMTPLLQDLVESGDLTAEAAASDPRRNQLRSALIGGDVPLVDISQSPAGFEKGDILVLASDGVLAVDDATITDILSRRGSLAAKTGKLLTKVLASGKQNLDNTTLLLCHHKSRSAWFSVLFPS